MAKRLSLEGNPVRRFNGEDYSRSGYFSSKADARSWTEKNLRSRGAKARIVKVKGGYQVWGRK